MDILLVVEAALSSAVAGRRIGMVSDAEVERMKNYAIEAAYDVRWGIPYMWHQSRVMNTKLTQGDAADVHGYLGVLGEYSLGDVEPLDDFEW